MKTLGCLKLTLENMGVSEEAIASVMKPFKTLNEKRSKFAGHGGATPDFDLVNDCRIILGEVEEALNSLILLLNTFQLK
jgi:hypothetical protein